MGAHGEEDGSDPTVDVGGGSVLWVQYVWGEIDGPPKFLGWHRPARARTRAQRPDVIHRAVFHFASFK